jgi:molybdopterin synthase catalytic subunit
VSGFLFSREPLVAADLARALADEACGALVTFEGRVRDHNDGRRVDRLEYEGYEALGTAEGSRIVAVWVGVSAHHRGDAFAACRYIIDEVKSRVPIWKKEFYSGGDSGWVNCEVAKR